MTLVLCGQGRRNLTDSGWHYDGKHEYTKVGAAVAIATKYGVSGSLAKQHNWPEVPPSYDLLNILDTSAPPTFRARDAE